MKTVFALILSLVLLAAAAAALAAAPEINRIEYEGNGFFEINFRKDVSYYNLTVAVRDAAGTDYPVEVYERDDDDLSFRAEGLQAGAVYEITVSGIRSGYSGNYETITEQINVPEAGIPAVQYIEYDRKDSELEIEFVEKVDFENPQVEITDVNGVVYQNRIIDIDKDGLELRVEGLAAGDNYTANINGVSLRGQNNYQSVSIDFIARDD